MFNSPMVVGYKGEIGRFILAGLLAHLPKANDIHCTDVNNSDEDVVERLEKADYVFLCVPLSATEEWLRRFLPHLKGKVVVEQASVKAFLYESPEFKEVDFISMHLLFRPSATAASDRRGLLFSNSRGRGELERFQHEAEAALETPFAILEPGEEPAYAMHDRIMARQQALVHRVLLALAESLDDERMRTYVGQRVSELAERIRAGDQDLYRRIQENPYLAGELDAFRIRLRQFDGV